MLNKTAPSFFTGRKLRPPGVGIEAAERRRDRGGCCCCCYCNSSNTACAVWWLALCARDAAWLTA